MMFDHPILPWIVLVQMGLGLLDIVWHHEMQEQLAWRTSQKKELVLHAARNLTYAFLFGLLGWSAPNGFWAALVLAALGLEVLITLRDFLEEDGSRKLPGTERVLHTVLAVNYGAILVVLVPDLIDRLSFESGLEPVTGIMAQLLGSIASAGCLLFGVREIAAVRRMERLSERPAVALADGLRRPMSVLVTGGTGFVGGRLVRALVEAGHEVTLLARDPAKAAAIATPVTVVTSLDQVRDTTAIDAIINLAGEPVAAGLWTASRKRRILRSRLRITRDVVRLVDRLRRPPQVLVSGSAIGWYGPQGEDALDETASPRRCFGNRVCDAWEAAASRVTRHGVRCVVLRIGRVLDPDGGMLRSLMIPFEFGLGGRMGDGRQWMSWITRDDLIRLIVHAIAEPAMRGPVNAVAPGAVRNADFTACLGKVLGRPTVLHVPASLLSMVAGEFAEELLLGSQKVVPAAALRHGFRFVHPQLEDAVRHMLGAHRRTTAGGALPVQRGWPRAGRSRDPSLAVSE